MKHSAALLICLSSLYFTLTTAQDHVDPLADHLTDGFRIRREVKSLATKQMLSSLRNTTGWKYLDHDVCGMSAKSVYRRRRSTSGQNYFNVTSRIVGGTEVKAGQFPWMARIFYKVGPVIQVGCGGTLISKRHVLTAAHCVTELPPGVKVTSIRLGVGKYTQSLAAQNAFYHASYDSRHMINDVALIQLSSPVVFNDYVAPLCLPLGDLSEKSFGGQSAIVAGWGKTETGLSSNKLLMVTLPVLDPKQCRERAHTYKIKNSHVCAGGDEGKDSCNGDSGGPLFLMDRQDGPNSPLRYTLVGVVSYGPEKCGTNGTPGVYSRVTYFLPWILKNMK